MRSEYDCWASAYSKIAENAERLEQSLNLCVYFAICFYKC